MRVIVTSMYFDAKDVPLSTSANPGIAFAWFKSYEDAPLLTEDELRGFELDDGQFENVGPIVIDDNDDAALRAFILSCLVNLSYVRIVGFSNPQRQYARLTDTVLDGDIVIERSPPSALHLRDIARNVSSSSVGTYVGFAAAGDNHTLLFITVPAGIIVVGAAVGIAKALESGLNKAFSRLFQRNQPPKSRSR